jgi:hypothetical protein
MARRKRMKRLKMPNCNRKLRFAESLTRFKSLKEAKTRSSGRKWNGGDGGTWEQLHQGIVKGERWTILNI